MPRKTEGRQKRAADARRVRQKALLAIIDYDPVLWYLHKGCSQEVREAWKTNARFTLLEGPQRSSKTTAGMAFVAAYLRGIHPARPWNGAVRGVIVIPSRPQSVTEWGPRLIGSYGGLYAPETAGCRLYKPDDPSMARRPWIPEDEISGVTKVACAAGVSLTAIRLTNGSEVFIVLGDEPSSWKPVESTSFDFVFRDEAIGNEALGASLVMRLGDAIQLDIDGVKPGGGWHLWTATEFLPSKELSDERRRCEDGKHPDHRRFLLTTTSNPACTTQAREVLTNAMSGVESAKRVSGARNASEDYRVYGAQFSRERHLLKHPWIIDPYDNLLLSLDPGVKNPFGIGVFAIRGDNPDQLIGIAYFAAVGTHGKDLLLDVATYLDGRPVTYVIYDPAANQTSKVTNKPLIDSIEEWIHEVGITVLGDFLPGNNRHEPTIQQVREYLDPSPWDTSVVPKILFDPFGPDMETAIDEMEAYRFEPKTRVVHKKDDTYPDVVRYLITQTPVYEPLAAAMAPRRRVNPLERFQAGDVGDMTSAQRDYYTSLLEMGDEDHAESENELYGIGR
jgi:hypothetical protein